MRHYRLEILFCLILCLGILLVYWQVHNFEFINYDDDVYITNNSMIQEGLTFKSIGQAFRSTLGALWIPLTWVSFMLDFEFYGLTPGGYHVTNMILHLLNSLLIFVLFRRMTGRFWESAILAALFALHPLRVESVAWVTERKDLLSTLFILVATGAYLIYIKTTQWRYYFLLALCYIFGLMAKPMVVIFPIILLLLDFWPLNRAPKSSLVWNKNAIDQRTRYPQVSWTRLFMEKLPLFVLSAMVSIITLLAQPEKIPMDILPLKFRIINAVVSYVSYIRKMIWPSDLAYFYVYHHQTLYTFLTSLLLLSLIFTMIIWSFKKYPYLLTGWLWFILTLLPVIGLVQSGNQSMADRFTYIPLIGLFIIIAWGGVELAVNTYGGRRLFLALLAIAITAYAGCSWKQAGTWKNNYTLNEHALKVTRNNWLAHLKLGNEYYYSGAYDRAASHYQEVINIRPKFYQMYNSLGLALSFQKKYDLSVKSFLRALELKPDYHEARYNLAETLFNKGDFRGALSRFEEILRQNPENQRAKKRVMEVKHMVGS